MGRLPPEVAQTLQTFTGVILTPDTRVEKAVFIHGPRGCGKSTYVDTVSIGLLGEKAATLRIQDIDSRFGLARIKGKTLLKATEQPRTYIENSETLNALISGEEVVVEEKGKDSYLYTSTAKVLWAMNELPHIKDWTSGIFRRVIPVEWPALDGMDADIDLKEKLRGEIPGILNWALEGLRRYREAGNRLLIPATLQIQTEMFEKANDPIGEFISEWIQLDETEEIDRKIVYADTANGAMSRATNPKLLTGSVGTLPLKDR